MTKQLKSAGLARRSVAELAAGEAPTVPGRAAKPAVERQLGVSVPEPVYRQLRMRAAERSTTVRVVLLGALQAAGFEIPAEAAQDRRGSAARARSKVG